MKHFLKRERESLRHTERGGAAVDGRPSDELEGEEDMQGEEEGAWRGAAWRTASHDTSLSLSFASRRPQRKTSWRRVTRFVTVTLQCMDHMDRRSEKKQHGLTPLIYGVTCQEARQG